MSVNVTSSRNSSFKVDICFLLIGQSNAVGINNSSGNESPLTESGIDRAFMWNNGWVPARDPMPHISESSEGASCARTFCRLWEADNQGKTIGIIPAAESGTSLGGGAWKKYGTKYQEAINRAKQAKLLATNFGGFIWLQGESDANASFASSYTANLEQMIADMRVDLGTSAAFLAAKIPDFSLSTYSPHAATVNAQIEAVSSTNFAFISTDSLSHNGDGSHFDVASQIIIGQRFYTAYTGL